MLNIFTVKRYAKYKTNHWNYFLYDITMSLDGVVMIVGVFEKQLSKNVPKNIQNCKNIYKKEKMNMMT